MSSYFMRCPRCGSRRLEILATHKHCIDCLYSPDLSPYVSQARSHLTLTEAIKLMTPASVQPIKPKDDLKKSVEVAI